MGYSYVVIRRGPRPSVTRLNDDHKPKENGILETEDSSQNDGVQADDPKDINLEQHLSLEAYSWPRLILPPLKRSGHVILDGCTKEGASIKFNISLLSYHEG